MRHLLFLTYEVLLLPGGVVGLAGFGSLVLLAGPPDALTLGFGSAAVKAVDVAMIAPGAQADLLMAPGTLIEPVRQGRSLDRASSLPDTGCGLV